MDEIKEKFANGTHNWEKTVIRFKDQQSDDLGLGECIISAVYVPHNTTHLTIECYGSTFVKIRWFEASNFREPLEDILRQSKELKFNTVDLDTHKRVVPFEPFIYIPDNLDVE